MLTLVSLVSCCACFDYENESDRASLALDCERVVNMYREHHQTRPLKHSDQLKTYSRNRINEMTEENMEKQGMMLHGMISLYSYKVPESADCNKYMYALYKGFYTFNFDRPFWSNMFSHFTQMVWDSSKEIGCATENQFFACSFEPKGNILGSGQWNVFERYDDGKIYKPPNPDKY